MKDWYSEADAAVTETAEAICKFREEEAFYNAELQKLKNRQITAPAVFNIALKNLEEEYEKHRENCFFNGTYANKKEQKSELITALRFCAACLAVNDVVVNAYQQVKMDILTVMQHELARVNGRRLCDEAFQKALAARLLPLAKQHSSPSGLMLFLFGLFSLFGKSAKQQKIYEQMKTYCGLRELELRSDRKKLQHYEGCNFSACGKSIALAVEREKAIDAKYAEWDRLNKQIDEQYNAEFQSTKEKIFQYLNRIPENYRNEQTLNGAAQLLEAGKAETMNDIYKIAEENLS